MHLTSMVWIPPSKQFSYLPINFLETAKINYKKFRELQFLTCQFLQHGEVFCIQYIILTSCLQVLGPVWCCLLSLGWVLSISLGKNPRNLFPGVQAWLGPGLIVSGYPNLFTCPCQLRLPGSTSHRHLRRCQFIVQFLTSNTWKPENIPYLTL